MDQHDLLETWQSHDQFCDYEGLHVLALTRLSNGSKAWRLSDGKQNLEYVNLVDNPERFTGYTGSSPALIWRAIYSENCFKYDRYAGPL